MSLQVTMSCLQPSSLITDTGLELEALPLDWTLQLLP